MIHAAATHNRTAMTGCRLDPARGDADKVIATTTKGNAMQLKWRVYAGAVAVVGLLASGFAALAQQKSEIAVSR